MVIHVKFSSIAIVFILLLLATVAFAAVPTVSQISYTPNPAVPGSTITVLVQIKNPDSALQRGVAVSITDKYPFTVKSDNPKIIGDIDNLNQAIAEFTVYVDPTTENKAYPLEITITTKDLPNGATTSRDLVVNGNAPLLKVVQTSVNRLLPGENKEVTFSIQNVGTSPAYDIIIELQEDRTVTATGTVVEREIIPLGAATAYVASINPSEVQTAKLTLSVNRSAILKNYVVPVQISYRDASGTRRSDTSNLGFDVSGNVEMDATLKERTTPIVVGAKNEITIELFNKGAGKAQFMIVEVTPSEGSIEKAKQFIGTLEPNDVDSFKTTLDLTGVRTSMIDLNIVIAYQDSGAEVRTTAISIPVKLANAADAGINPLIIIVVLAVIVFVGWNVRKYLMKKK